MMTLSDLLALYDQEERLYAEFPYLRREAFPWGVRHVAVEGAPGPRDGVVLYSRLTEQNVELVIDDQVAYFASLDFSFEWKVYAHDTPPDLRERLAGRGFQIEEAEAIMVLDLEQAPPLLLAPVTHDVRRIVDPEQVAPALAVQAEVWQEDRDDLARYLSVTLCEAPDSLAMYAAYAGDRIVSSAWLFFRPPSRFASLWGGSTLAEYRKRGYYTALLATRVQEAIRRGARFLTIDASPMSRPIVEKTGFRQITTAFACHWQPPQAAVPPASPKH